MSRAGWGKDTEPVVADGLEDLFRYILRLAAALKHGVQLLSYG
jgi:hypothetical protein